MTAIALALGTSVAYGCSNFLGPLLSRRYPIGAVLLTGQTAAVLTAMIALAISGERLPGLHGAWLGVAAGVCNALAIWGIYRAAELGPLSLVAPVASTGAVIPVVYGLASGERLGTLEGIGIALALAGVILAARRPADLGADVDVEGRADLRRCVAISLLSAAGIGGFLILLPKASGHGRWWALTDARAALVVFLFVLFALRGQLARPPSVRAALPMTVPGILLIGGSLLYILAGEHGSLSVVAVVASLNPVLTVGLAFLVLRERLAPVQAVGVVAALAGVILVAA